ncbi:MAG: energy-coupling factor transporter transmembrane component T [Pseudomonadota bacterium]
METLSALHYRTGTSLLHRLDVRCKLVCLCALSMGLVWAGLSALIAVTVMAAALMVNSKIHPVRVMADLKLFFLLLGCIFVSRSLFTPGDSALHWWVFDITQQGLVQGGLVVWRFLLVMVLGLLFSATTRPSLVKGAAQWLITPLPFIPASRVALMAGLFMRFMPMLLGQFKDVALAQKARCGDLGRNPVKRMARIAVPMIRKTFQSADRLTLAMEARCFSETRTEAQFIRSGLEAPALGLCLALFLVMVFA